MSAGLSVGEVQRPSTLHSRWGSGWLGAVASVGGWWEGGREGGGPARPPALCSWWAPPGSALGCVCVWVGGGGDCECGAVSEGRQQLKRLPPPPTPPRPPTPAPVQPHAHHHAGRGWPPGAGGLPALLRTIHEIQVGARPARTAFVAAMCLRATSMHRAPLTHGLQAGAFFAWRTVALLGSWGGMSPPGGFQEPLTCPHLPETRPPLGALVAPWLSACVAGC